MPASSRIPQHSCIFCGSMHMATYKNISTQQVEAIVATHKAVSLECPVSNLTTTLIDNTRRNYIREAASEDAFDEPCVITCMCCHHWIKRRQRQAIVPLPMQTLRWFLLTLQSCEHKRCDIRVMLRMARTITTNYANIYRSLFESTELEFLHYLTSSYKNSSRHSSDQIKCCIARFWHSQNGHTLFLPSASIAELLRVPHDEMSYI